MPEKTKQQKRTSGDPSQKENKEASPARDGLLTLGGFPGQGMGWGPRQSLWLLEWDRSQEGTAVRVTEGMGRGAAWGSANAEERSPGMFN